MLEVGNGGRDGAERPVRFWRVRSSRAARSPMAAGARAAGAKTPSVMKREMMRWVVRSQ